VPALQAEVSWAWEAVATEEATCVAVVPTVETSAQEADAALDSTTLCVKDVEDWAIIAEREAGERVSRSEAENAAALAFAHENAEALVRKITLLEGKRAEERWA
jgi:hypothetical protein